MNLNQMKQAHPMPWRYVVIGNSVQLVDAAGVELSMFLMLDFVTMVTTAMANQDAKEVAGQSL